MNKGLNLTKVLIGLLMNFRLYKIALTADIKSAYLQIGLNELDCDATRFLWIKDINGDVKSHHNMRFLRFYRVPFGINASPFLLNMVLQSHFAEDEQNEWSRIGRGKFYIDNFVISVRTYIQAMQVYEYLNEKFNRI